MTDPALFRGSRRNGRLGARPRDEMWDGTTSCPHLPNLEHQIFTAELWLRLLDSVLEWSAGPGPPGFNVSDREEGWNENDREPDLGVYLTGNPSRKCGTHMCGGPDFAVEILSPDDPARRKLDLYAASGPGTLAFDRDPWALELYRLIDGRLELVGDLDPGIPPS